MKTLKVHYDGSVLVPDEPVDLPLNRSLELSVVAINKPSEAPAALDKLVALAQNHPARSSHLPLSRASASRSSPDCCEGPLDNIWGWVISSTVNE